LTVFSQTVTKISISDSNVILPKIVAREVVKDIIKKDSCEAEIAIIKDNNQKLQTIVNYKDNIILSKDSIITLHKQKEASDSIIMQLKDQQKNNLEILSKDLGKQVQKAKRKSTLLGIGGITAVVITTLLILK